MRIPATCDAYRLRRFLCTWCAAFCTMVGRHLARLLEIGVGRAAVQAGVSPSGWRMGRFAIPSVDDVRRYTVVTLRVADETMTDPICLDQLLKLCGVAATGGQAKLMIQDGMVTVNGEIELRRRRKLNRGDLVEIDGETLVVDEFLQ